MDIAENVMLDQEMSDLSGAKFDLCAVVLYFYDIKIAN